MNKQELEEWAEEVRRKNALRAVIAIERAESALRVVAQTGAAAYTAGIIQTDLEEARRLVARVSGAIATYYETDPLKKT